MRFILTLAVLVSLGSLVPADAVSGQTITGTVVEAETSQPLPGAFIVLEDEAGNRQGGVLAGEGGRFVLRAPEPGRYRLIAQLIGYEDGVGPLVMVGAGESVQQRLEVPVRAIDLEGIRVEVERRCYGRPDRELRTGRLWEEARKALTIAAWTEEQEALRFQMIERRRELDAVTLRTTAMEETGRRGYYDSSPYLSLPAEELEAEGYVQPAPDGLWDHFAPDAEVLLSDSFLDTHCFRVRQGEDPDLVGLAFEPVPGRKVPEIEGVLWLDRGTAELQHLEFRYVNLPYPSGDWPQVGGRVEFERLATGNWIVRRWRIRMPLAAERSGGFGGARQSVELVSLVEDAAEVSQVRTDDGTLLAESTTATLYGTVEDSVSGQPLAGATVELLPTGRSATTGPDGAYRMSGVADGQFQLRVTHPDLELLGAEPAPVDVRLNPGRATRVPLRPPLSTLARELCEGAGSFRNPVVLHGTVLDPEDQEPVPGAVVRVFDDGPERRVAADTAGGYATCVERSDVVSLAAVGPTDVLDPQGLDRVEVRPGAGAVARADLTLDRQAMTARSAASASGSQARQSRNIMVGTVVGAEDRAPIAGAMVLIRKEDGTPVYSEVTDEQGKFRLVHPDQATRDYTLSVEHVAYADVSQEISFAPGEQLDLEVRLSETAIELEPIIVTERRRGLLVDVGFYDRLERGAGLYIEREEIERRAPSRLTDLMQGRAGLRVVGMGGLSYDVRLRASDRVSGDCQPTIWLDGALVRDGGAVRTTSMPQAGSSMVTQIQLSDVISPEQVEAVEVYTGPAGLPLQFGGSNAMCGVIVIWSRDGL